MCALFWARGAERYLKPRGRLAFVLPFAVLNAPVFAGLRGGNLGQCQAEGFDEESGRRGGHRGGTKVTVVENDVAAESADSN